MSRKLFSSAFAVMAFVSILWPSSVQAHALLASTEPASDQVVVESPARVTTIFSEPVEIAFGALRVHDTNAERVDVGDASHPGGDPESVSVSLLPDLPEGTYTVTYRVISADAHPIEGAFVFHVGRPGEKAAGIGETLLAGEGGSGTLEQVLYGAARWMLFCGLVIFGGALIFIPFVWERSRGIGAEDPLSVGDRGFIYRWRKALRWSWSLTVIATIAGFLLQGAVAADLAVVDAVSPDVAGELLKTRYGLMAAIRFGVLLLLAGAWLLVVRAHPKEPPWPLKQPSTVGAEAIGSQIPTGLVIAALALFGVLAVGPGLSGHAGATSPVWLNVLADGLHVAAAAAWMGGLTILAFVAYRSYSSIDDPEGMKVLGNLVSRFSDLAMVSIAVLVATGVYRTWVEVQAWRAFVDAPYGWVLLTKIGVFLPLLAMGAINNRILKPRIQRAVDGASGLGVLRKIVSAEIALGVVVLVLTALLVNLPPAKVEAGVTGPFITTVALGEDNLEILIDPNEAGENIIHLTAKTAEGSPAEIKAMKVRFRMPEEDIGPLIANGRMLAPGHFVIQGRELSIPGIWSLSIEARIDKFTNTHADLEVVVNR